MKKARPYSPEQLKGDTPQRTFRGRQLLQIAMPLGGIGAGCICFNGQGGLGDFSIHNRPSLSTGADAGALHLHHCAFALLHVKGPKGITKLLEGPMPAERIYNQGLRAKGYDGGGFEGLPRFEKCSFRGEYPFGRVRLADRAVPLGVEITGWNPFVPLDDKNSSIPCAILEYTLTNRSKKKVDYEFSYHLSHLAPGPNGWRDTFSSSVGGMGVFFSNAAHRNHEQFGSAALAVVGHRPRIKAAWFRGRYFDALTGLWREVSTGRFRSNRGTGRPRETNKSGGSILLAGSLNSGASVTYPIIITWYFPNVHWRYSETTNDRCGLERGRRKGRVPAPRWRPYYTSQWSNALEAAVYVKERYTSLRARTQAFHDALFASTLPSYVLDAVSANLAIIKSPTVLRQENGNLWVWEGCGHNSGCCGGSCTHVWNYAQAIAHLFPQLARTLREGELLRSMDERGHVAFRAALPDGPIGHSHHAACDGQLGGVMKLYRDWQICGDRRWLEKMYPPARRSIEYCIKTWDPRHQGVPIEPHHNTYDIEFWGPDGMCSSIYLGALSAMACLARDAGRPKEAIRYEQLARRGAAYLDKHLFNGEYYHQKVAWKGLRDKSFAREIASVNARSTEEAKLLKKEGPKYQYGGGCLSDGVIGAWMAGLYGIETPQTRANIRKNLKAVFQYNFRHSLRNHPCTQRAGYAMGAEPGLVLCSWPKGGEPTLPFIYSDEVWTGIEYQVASHLIAEGMVAEGLTIVKAARSRYDGLTRNPWNEYECGGYYARAVQLRTAVGAVWFPVLGRHQDAVAWPEDSDPEVQGVLLGGVGLWDNLDIEGAGDYRDGRGRPCGGELVLDPRRPDKEDSPRHNRKGRQKDNDPNCLVSSPIFRR